VTEVRVNEKHGTTPTERVIDAKSAIRWLRLRAGEWGVPTDRIAGSGGSAAGTVALCTAMVDGFEEPGEGESVSAAPNVVCVFNPAVLPRIDEAASENERVRMRIQKFGGAMRLWRLSPTRAVRPELPPVLIMYGDRDEITPLSESQAFADAMTAVGSECRLLCYPGEGHGFFNYRPEGNLRYVDAVRHMDRFLAEHDFPRSR
jgi:acetyl esterase/lipase